jgi:hypothetical protein
MGFIALVIVEAVFLSIMVLAVDWVFTGSALTILVKILAVGLIQKAILWFAAVSSGWSPGGNEYTPPPPKGDVRDFKELTPLEGCVIDDIVNDGK